MVKFAGYFRSGCFNVYNSLFPLTEHFVPICKNTSFQYVRTLCFYISEHFVSLYWNKVFTVMN